MPSLNDVSVLLVETQSVGNIGSVARVMKNMGLQNLVLVDCKTDLSADAYNYACGADDIINQCQRANSLKEALESFSLSVGTSSRFVSWIPTVYQPAELAQQVQQLLNKQRIALVFGPERTGLTNEHLQYCQWLVTIPSNPEFESLNLSHAVAIIVYEIYKCLAPRELGRALELASLEKVERFYSHLGNCLLEIGFLNEENPELIMATLRQIFSRALLEERDVQILLGVLRQWSWYANKLKQQQN